MCGNGKNEGEGGEGKRDKAMLTTGDYGILGAAVDVTVGEALHNGIIASGAEGYLKMFF